MNQDKIHENSKIADNGYQFEDKYFKAADIDVVSQERRSIVRPQRGNM